MWSRVEETRQACAPIDGRTMNYCLLLLDFLLAVPIKILKLRQLFYSAISMSGRLHPTTENHRHIRMDVEA